MSVLHETCMRCRVEAAPAPSRPGWYGLCPQCARDLAGLMVLDENTPYQTRPRRHLHEDIDAWIYDALEENR